MIRRRIARVVLYLPLFLTALCLWAFGERYWAIRACRDDTGRCFDPDTGTVVTSSTFVYGPLTALFAAVSLLMLIILQRAR